ncbi:unnamed protein product [Amaranthus hypochondriacus]
MDTNKNRYIDEIKLSRSFHVEFQDDDVTKMVVALDGPKNSLYDGYRFRVVVELEEGYPTQKAPVVYFQTTILHPNIDYSSGFPCISALENENWGANSKLEHILEYILPQLLCNPNFNDPYNTDAVEMYVASVEDYEAAVKRNCEENAELI